MTFASLSELGNSHITTSSSGSRTSAHCHLSLNTFCCSNCVSGSAGRAQGKDAVPPGKVAHSRSHPEPRPSRRGSCTASVTTPAHTFNLAILIRSNPKMSSHSFPAWLYLLECKLLAKASDKAVALLSSFCLVPSPHGGDAADITWQSLNSHRHSPEVPIYLPHPW